MRTRQKFDGTVLVELGAVLKGELVTDYAAAHAQRPSRVYFAVLSFGDCELARWDVTDQRAEFEEQPGSYWSGNDKEDAEEAFVERFIGARLAAVFGALDGAIKP